MPAERELREGESFLSVCRESGILPETAWEAPENAALRERRKDFDAMQPGDTFSLPELSEGEASAATDATHRFRRKGTLGLFVRLELPSEDEDDDDDEASSEGEPPDSDEEEDDPDDEPRFRLQASDGSYSCEKSLADDRIPGDAFVDLHFSGLLPTKSYTLEVLSADGEPTPVFEDVPYEQLAGLEGEDEEALEEEDDEDEEALEDDEPSADLEDLDDEEEEFDDEEFEDER